MIDRAQELIALAQQLENDRRDRVFLRKKILSKLALLEEFEALGAFCSEARKMLRRQLELSKIRALLTEIEAVQHEVSTAVDVSESTELSANDGQTVRHQSRSKEERKDTRDPQTESVPEVGTLTTVCNQATSFATSPLRTWKDVEYHARSLAPMMGIDPSNFERAARFVGPRKASCAIFIMLQLGTHIRDFAAYFQSITIGQRKDRFQPGYLLRRLSATNELSA